MHTMQEASVEAQEESSNGFGNGLAYSSRSTKMKGESRPPDIRDTLLVCIGMLLPLLAQLGHGH